MKIFYSDHFPLPLPVGHRFPMRKYSMLRSRVRKSGLVPESDLSAPPAATRRELRRAHSRDYLEKVESGRLSPAEERRIGFPWSPQMVERSRRSSGATAQACRAALTEGVAVNLAGGTHHAFRDRGEGFCVFNDSLIAARAVQAEGRARRVIIIDCDVHQGDGSASIAADDPSIFTFSIHGARNYPFRKERSDLDIGLPDGARDRDYLEALAPALDTALESFRPDLAVYIAGADPFEGDRLGRLSLTQDGLLRRDRLVLRRCRESGLPVAVTMGGGYAPRLEDIVEIHFNTVVTAAQFGNGSVRRGP